MSAPELTQIWDGFDLPDISCGCRAYDRTMRHKLGLLELEQEADEGLIRDLLQVSNGCDRVLPCHLSCSAMAKLVLRPDDCTRLCRKFGCLGVRLDRRRQVILNHSP